MGANEGLNVGRKEFDCFLPFDKITCLLLLLRRKCASTEMVREVSLNSPKSTFKPQYEHKIHTLSLQ